MKRLPAISKIVLFLLFTVTCSVLGQSKFRVLSGLPHLPMVDPASITTPEPGMLVFSTQDKTPMIYTGVSWENLCSSTLNTVTSKDFVAVKNGIPYIPSLTSNPTIGPLEQGVIYYSKTNNSLMIHNGSDWSKVSDISSINFIKNTGFSARKTFKLPILDIDPTPANLTAGALYINIATKSIRFYDGSIWKDINCGVVISTVLPTDITSTTATTGGLITNTAGLVVLTQGVCIGNSVNPNIVSGTTTTLPGSGVGSFACNLTDLQPNTTYHVRAFATTSAGVTYGEDKVFKTTVTVPTIITSAATDISNTTTVSGGNIVSDGGAQITARGIVWSTTTDPQADANKIVTHDGSGVGPFPSTLTGLLELTTYYVQAYAVNAYGTAYGNVVSFTTPAAVAPVLNSSDIQMSSIGDVSAVGDVVILNNGGAPVLERGIMWSQDNVTFTKVPSTTVNVSDIGKYSSTINGLLSGITYYVKGYATNKAGTNYSSITSFVTTSYVVLVTTPPTGVNRTSAGSGGEITNSGSATISIRGVCWSTTKNPTVDLPTKTAQSVTGAGTGAFSSYLSGLTPNTVYYLRAYAVNSHGISYGNLDSLATIDYPTVVTIPVSSFVSLSANAGGDVTDDGRSLVTDRGVCWSTLVDPAIGDGHSRYTRNGTGTGQFASEMTNLTPNVTYHLRAYATNEVGTVYGNDYTFLLLPTAPIITTIDASNITNKTAATGSNLVSTGGAPVTERGIIWSNLFDPKDDVAAIKTVDATTEGSVPVALTNLLGNTTYYVRAYAVNSVGKTYGDLVQFNTMPVTKPIFSSSALNVTDITNISAGVNFTISSNGGAPVTARGIIISTDRLTLDDIAAPFNESTDVGTYNIKLTGLTEGTTYYVYGYAANSKGITYTDESIFSTTQLANLVTASVTNITGTTAVSGGEVVSNTEATLVAKGICWSTNQYPTREDRRTSEAITSDGLGVFASSMTGLLPNTTYYVRAYAANSKGTAYGNQYTFITATQPTLITNPVSGVTSTTAVSGGNIDNDGRMPVTSRGICWSLYTSAPEINSANTKEGTGTGSFTSNMTGLLANTTYYVRAYAANGVTLNGTSVAYGNTVSFFTGPASLATLKTNAVTAIASTSATSGGTITDNGGEPNSTRGICWSTLNGPTINDNHVSNGIGSGNFTSKMIDLMGSTRYYVRAYAINSAGTSYGDEVAFISAPPVLPTLTTTTVTNVGGTTARSGGFISSNGGANVTLRGVCWSTSATPTIADNYIFAGEGSGSFYVDIIDLTPTTKYYIRAFAVNSEGISYGNELSFSTFTTPTLTTTVATAITSSSVVSGGFIEKDGGVPVISSGICWNTVGSPTLTDTHTTIGTGIGEFINSITGLLGNTTYYIRAYATNNAGTAYGNEQIFTTKPPVLATLTTKPTTSGSDGVSAPSGGIVSSNGGGIITSVGICWSISPNFDPSTVFSNRVSKAGTGTFDITITGLSTGTTYYVKAFAVNSAGTAYADNESSFTTPRLATVTTTTPPIATVLRTTAIGEGNITNDGGATVTKSGLCWSITENPTVADGHTTAGTGTGSFIHTMTGLMGSTTYYVRAYATNSVGVAYGNTESMTTMPPEIPTLTTGVPTLNSSTSARVGGNISSDGGAMVTTRGLVWSISPNFDPSTVTANKTAQTGYFTGNFTADMSGLTPATIYYVRAYVINSVGVAYGNEVSFITPKLATLTTVYASSQTSNTAGSGGDITDDGGAYISSRGVIWSTTPDFVPEISSPNKTIDGGDKGSFVSKLTFLVASTKYYVRAYASSIAGTSYGNQVSFTTSPPDFASITTKATKIVRWNTTVTAGGYINNDGGAPVTTRGVVWSEFPNFKPDTVVVNKTAETGNYTGNYRTEFDCTTPLLKQNTTYYMRAYGQNIVGIAYGNEVSFTTVGVPTLATVPIGASATGYTAMSGGTIVNTGQSTVSDRGVCWSVGPNPTVGLFTKTSQGYGSSFTSKIVGLSPLTTYYVRAYAVNDLGLAYGDETTFTTPASVPILSTTYASSTSSNSILTGGEITSNGGASVTSRGVRWSNIANFNPDTVSVAQTVDGAGTGIFVSNILNLKSSTTYYVRAYATNSAGTGYGNQVNMSLFPTSPILAPTVASSVTGVSAIGAGRVTSDGGDLVTSRGICWSTVSNPTTKDSKIVCGKDTGSYVGNMTGLIPNTIYYVRSYAINNIGTAYGLETTLQTASLPTLSGTASATSILTTTATSGGLITDDGRSPILTRGVCWSLYGNPTIALSTKTVDNTSTGIGSFIAKLTGLVPNKMYYVRSYATNSVGVTYGSEISFTTADVMLPTITTSTPSAITSNTATAGGEVLDEGGVAVTSRGLYWGTVNPPLTKVPAAVGGSGVFTTSLSGLLPNTKYYVQAYAINTVGTVNGDVKSFTTQVMVPKLSVPSISGLTINTAVGIATVTDNGGDALTDMGLCWNTTGIDPSLINAVPNATIGTTINGTITNLTPGTRYYVWAYGTNRGGTGYSASPISFTSPTLAALTTKAVNTITFNTAKSGGNITSEGGAPVTKRGTCWSTVSPPYSYDSHIDDASGGSGSYVATLTGLNGRTTYYVRSYAVSSLGTSYGNTLSFTTLSNAILTTNEVSSITSNSALTGGEITDDGGSQILAWGVCWNTATNPTTANNKVSTSSGSSASFSNTLTGLLPNTTYYVRSFAVTLQGTSYGTLQSFITMGAVPVLSSVTISSVTGTSAMTAATITTEGGTIIDRGVRWNTTGIIPTEADNTLSNGYFATTIGGKIDNLVGATKYYVWAYAKSDIGTGYSATPATFTTPLLGNITTTKPVSITGTTASTGGNVLSDGGATITARGVCWSTSDFPTIADNILAYASGGTGAFTSNIAGLTGGVKYYLRAYATNSVGTTYGGVENFTTLTTPTLTTVAVTAVTSNSAVCGGNISSDGGASVSVRGVCWSTTTGPIATGNHAVAAAGGIGDFTCNIIGLLPVTSYFVRAYATSSQGTSYGNEVILTALPVPPTVGSLVLSNMTSSTANWSATVTDGGGAVVTDRGLCWNTAGLPVVTDNKMASGTGVGSFNDMLTGLIEGPTYYVRAYATNAGGTSYSAVQTFKICPTFTVIHKLASGSPVDNKTITYNSINSNITGSSLCWITKNLGADLQAASATDITEEPMGWYWQFNRSQGYQYTPVTPRTPVVWATSINETSDWLAENDPCLLQLGPGWRLPTNAEWTAADAAPQSWVKAADAYNSVLKLHNAGYITAA
ncbi:MAG: hypothetical protein JZU53_15860, partial [Paludibacter sp.]|nr:hypothetical protein [Paludibacter sp.]